ncbi:MAG: hypothetical protein RLN88_05525 [Ekhidna sp.]|uniref:hypothetical protein n=1 Tax=Ekhidna sp. TaxID=2608089 RepID=UPI0032ECE2FE
MSSKIFIAGLLFCAVAFAASAQRIVVDSTSSNKYLMKPPEKSVVKEMPEEDLTFSDRAMSIGKGILNRLKARLNLEEAAESIKDKKERILGKQEDEEEKDDG